MKETGAINNSFEIDEKRQRKAVMTALSELSLWRRQHLSETYEEKSTEETQELWKEAKEPLKAALKGK
jgi:hypothetical protein